MKTLVALAAAVGALAFGTAPAGAATAPAGIAAIGGTPQSATVGSTFVAPLSAEVTASDGSALAGVTVMFSIAAQSGAGASFAGGAPNATAVTNASGVATSPPLVANAVTGSYTAYASTAGVTAVATFSLTNAAGAPASVTAGVGASQSALVGGVFAVPLAVAVDDTDHNPVPGAGVTFTAPSG